MKKPAPVPVLKKKDKVTVRDVLHLAQKRAAYGAHKRRWVMSLQNHIRDIIRKKGRKE